MLCIYTMPLVLCNNCWLKTVYSNQYIIICGLLETDGMYCPKLYFWVNEYSKWTLGDFKRCDSSDYLFQFHKRFILKLYINFNFSDFLDKRLDSVLVVTSVYLWRKYPDVNIKLYIYIGNIAKLSLINGM